MIKIMKNLISVAHFLTRRAIVVLAIMIAGLGTTAHAQQGKRLPSGQQELKMSFAPLVKQTSEAVVNVYAERQVQQRSPFAGDPFFERFFGRQMPNRSERQSSLGSGVVIDESGIVITNNHVIEGADDIKVAFSNGREYSSRILLKDESVDIAILQIQDDRRNSPGFKALSFGDSDALEVGDIVLAIGNPFGVGQTVTSGIVSALARNQVGVSDFGFFIQTDAAINPGNSGGALIDMNGNLIGINTAIFSRSGGSNGIGFAIPANMVRAVTTAAIGGDDTFVRPFIGATFETVTSDIAEALGLNRAIGALVSSLIPGGPAQAAGLREGDVVFAFNGQPIQHPDALGYRLATAGIGSVVELGVHSRGRNRGVRIRLAEPPRQLAPQTQVISGRVPFAGAEVAELNAYLADQLRLPVNRKGVVILDIERGSRAQRYGFKKGDVITSLFNRPVTSMVELERALNRATSLWRIEIIRDGRRIRQILR
ncbi:MAG: DegQ family serine endoprotease [Rhizobiaceae bacterium]|nr:DegQ family serine endoprotease [Rhizobiaceae bacterium]